MRTVLAGWLLVVLSSAAAAAPQFVTLERVDRESRLGLQASLQLYPDASDVFGLRTELYGQAAGQLRAGGAIGGYAHISVGALFGDVDSEAAITNLELGGFYDARLGAGTDLALHLGVALPTASDDLRKVIANIYTALERNYDWINVASDTTTLNLGATLHARLGATAFLQADAAVDLTIHTPSKNNQTFLHLNLGLGGYAGQLLILGELATTLHEGDLLGSLALGLRFPGAAHPHLAYVMAFSDDAFIGESGIVAHILSFGVYTDFR